MARRERLLDPETDQLHKFAHDLRQVRTAAGNPTYRVLAKRAGYSATSLSDAARGVRIPTLEVVLAYVGACDGDRELWTQRWHALFTAEEAEPEVRESVQDPPRKRRTRLLALAAVVLVAAAIAVTVVLQQPGRAAACPKLSGRSLFTGETYGAGVLAYDAASTTAPVAQTIAENCVLGFTGYCVGEKQTDATAHTPDVRWFILTDGSMVPSGRIHGNPPRTVGPTRCRGDRPPPESLTVSITADPLDPESITATASGVHVDIVGFAEQWVDETGKGIGEKPWRQTGFTDEDNFRASWSSAAAPATGASQRVIMAVACLGGSAPSAAMHLAAATSTGSVQHLDQQKLSPDASAAGAMTACRYPKKTT
ncbi:helix-turn-helix transcriptional regulator [Actinoplanes sp. NBRC 103695]|uniref:helix-turn-helix domain-containing protein n=1 Tax=Actinoplanes sp. NBRC 103695 TaxID=3032202 RepID=UPI0024A2807A|nr:helix-turn-helix transcriptional regulator [Actinoplanes sp. NBRC 103695]GLY97325.1 hypothetical protein Acsp02_45790 [Actinoplanes sp. NBRC 103695]